MNTKQTEALKLALEALNRNDYLGWQTNIHVRQAIREALMSVPDGAQSRSDEEQPAQQQEPVARSKAYDMIDRFLRNNLNSDEDYAEYSTALDSLYTSPPASKPWVGLTDEEWQDLSDRYGLIIWGPFKREIEDKLLEKNE